MRPIHHTFAPHVDSKYVGWAISGLLRPLSWRKGSSIAELETVLSQWFDGQASLFFSGRDALLAVLRACDFESGSEILIQGYTCIALPNAIHAAGYTPVYADIDPNTLNLDLESVRTKITHRTKAIICQHTFGFTADTNALRELADAHNLLLIEDCAHIIPDVSGPKSIGKHADAVMLSFGRDKAVSGVLGGAIVIKNEKLRDGMELENQRKKHASPITVLLALHYPLLYFLARPLYGLGIGKALLWLASKLGLLIPVLTRSEKRGFQNPALKQMPNASARIVRKQLRNFHSYNNRRRVLSRKYIAAAKEHNWQVPSLVTENFPLQKFPIFVPNADKVRSQLKPKNIHLDDGWTGATVCPRTVDQEAAGYIAGTCPRAERVEREIVSLPTHPTMSQKQADKLIQILATILK